MRLEDVTIRPEAPRDLPAISDVVKAAFAGVGYSDHREHLMVDRLRGSDAFLPALSLVADVAGTLVGHVMLTRVAIRGEGGSVPSLCLAPLSVLPAYQRRGIGGGLVEAAHARARAMGFTSITVLGHPGYYRRFGYEPMASYGLTVPFPVREANRMVAWLDGDGSPRPGGSVAYPPAFMRTS